MLHYRLVLHDYSSYEYNILLELSLQHHQSSNYIFFTSLRGYDVAGHDDDDAGTAHVHGVALEPQLALPLWTKHCVLHGPEHQRRSAL